MENNRTKLVETEGVEPSSGL